MAHVLSGPALAMLLIILDAQASRRADTDLWFSQRVAEQGYALSEETRGKGLAELEAFDLLQTSRASVTAKADALGSPRVRHVHRLALDRLRASPVASA